jgi:hypothetical protein
LNTLVILAPLPENDVAAKFPDELIVAVLVVPEQNL